MGLYGNNILDITEKNIGIMIENAIISIDELAVVNEGIDIKQKIKNIVEKAKKIIEKVVKFIKDKVNFIISKFKKKDERIPREDLARMGVKVSDFDHFKDEDIEVTVFPDKKIEVLPSIDFNSEIESKLDVLYNFTKGDYTEEDLTKSNEKSSEFVEFVDKKCEEYSEKIDSLTIPVTEKKNIRPRQLWDYITDICKLYDHVNSSLIKSTDVFKTIDSIADKFKEEAKNLEYYYNIIQDKDNPDTETKIFINLVKSVIHLAYEYRKVVIKADDYGKSIYNYKKKIMDANQHVIELVKKYRPEDARDKKKFYQSL